MIADYFQTRISQRKRIVSTQARHVYDQHTRAFTTDMLRREVTKSKWERRLNLVGLVQRVIRRGRRA